MRHNMQLNLVTDCPAAIEKCAQTHGPLKQKTNESDGQKNYEVVSN